MSSSVCSRLTHSACTMRAHRKPGKRMTRTITVSKPTSFTLSPQHSIRPSAGLTSSPGGSRPVLVGRHLQALMVSRPFPIRLHHPQPSVRPESQQDSGVSNPPASWPSLPRRALSTILRHERLSERLVSALRSVFARLTFSMTPFDDTTTLPQSSTACETQARGSQGSAISRERKQRARHLGRDTR